MRNKKAQVQPQQAQPAATPAKPVSNQNISATMPGTVDPTEGQQQGKKKMFSTMNIILLVVLLALIGVMVYMFLF